MVKKTKASRANSHRGLSSVAKPRSAKTRTTGKRFRIGNTFEEQWDGFKDTALTKVQQSVSASATVKLAPFDRADSVLKRLVYDFILKHRPTRGYGHIETAIVYDRDDGRALRIRFEDNPFHWVLFGLKDYVQVVGEFEILKSDVTRYGRQLNYADRHEIAPELLIGFLMQTGSISEVCRRAVEHPMRYEGWFIAKQQAEQGPVATT